MVVVVDLDLPLSSSFSSVSSHLSSSSLVVEYTSIPLTVLHYLLDV